MIKYPKIPRQGSQALELAMQDVLGGLQEAAGYFAGRSVANTMQILSIEPPRAQQQNRQTRASVHRVPLQRSNNIVDYLITRERRVS